MHLLRVLFVGLMLAVPPAQAMVGLRCRDGDRYQADHCGIPARSNHPQVSAMHESPPTACLEMQACREPAPYQLIRGGDQVSSLDLLWATLAAVSTLQSAAPERPPTPPPNG